MTEEISGRSKGLLESLTTLAATLVASAHTRLELLSTDLEEEREHLLSLLLLVLAALFFLGVSVVLTTILLVPAFWDTDRILVLGTLAAMFLATSVAVWLYAKRKARAKPRVFDATLKELVKDWQHLDSNP